ncbi:alpha/beta hydrolase [Allorhizobium sp. BGMRC 0089]|uniref:alpha/beta hydrolase n=1 Tax=Allorhizobium sonneratiae TaxID=2934936 RepID=UPI00203493DE|nr:alpha/beta hydrolase [Allorhizobium sonneratiae]MCM2290845.1 alpha/beta hydrolase [Allorhizobium sonneratiae]
MTAILHPSTGNPVPEPHQSGFFTGHDGVRLRYAVFPATAEPKGTVVLVHGRSEFIEKYFETIRDLTAQGFAVATYDLRGQGLSDRPLKNRLLGHVNRFADYERDLALFIDQIVRPACPAPLHLLGHSTGGLIVLSAAPALVGRISRMVLSAPFVGLHGEALSQGKVFALTRFLSMIGLGSLPMGTSGKSAEFATNPLTTDEARYQRNTGFFASLPDLALGAPTARWLSECGKAIARVRTRSHLSLITMPTLLIAPQEDGVVPFKAQQTLVRDFSTCRLLPIPGARHEVLQEKEALRQQALKAMLDFLREAHA